MANSGKIATILGNVLTDSEIDLSTKADLVGGLIPSSQLPSYVDDVLEYTNLAGFPATGEAGKIYVALNNNQIYRWSGSAYIEVSAQVGTIWGGITGTLSNQTDLQTALNAKQNSLSGTGFVKISGTTISYDNNTYLTSSTVLNTVLTPYVVGANTAVTTSDTIETAIEKLQGQVSARQATLNGTGYVRMAGTTVSYLAGATAATANTVVERDASGFISANQFNGVNTALNTIRGNLGDPTTDEKSIFHGQFNNKFRFIAPTLQEESTDGTTWTTSTRASANQLADMMIGEGQGTSFNAIPTGTAGTYGGYRLTWDVVGTTGYIFLNQFYAYCSTQGNNVTFLIEAFHNTNGWTTIASGTNSNWPGHVSLRHSRIEYSSSASQIGRVRVTFSTTRTNTNTFQLFAIEWFGGYPQGRRNVEFYDRNRNVTFPAAINGTSFIRSGGTAAEYLMADGSVSTGPSLTGFVPTSRTLSINGTTFDLSANRSWTIAPSSSARTEQTFTATAGQTTFTVTGGYVVGLVDVFVNGVKYQPADYTATNGSTVVLTTGALVGDIVSIINYTSTIAALPTSRDVIDYTATANQTVFTVSGGYVVGLLDVYSNGVKLTSSEFTATNGTSFTLTFAAVTGDQIQAIRYNASVTGISGSGTANFIPKFTATGTVGNSLIQDNGTTITLGGALAGTSALFTGQVTAASSSFLEPSLIARSSSSNFGTIQFGDSSNYTIRAGSDLVGMEVIVGGSQRLLIVDNGNVGIGATSPYTKLDVSGSISINGRPVFDNSTTELYIGGITGVSGRGTDTISLYTANTERVRITSAGNVGIGTTNPGFALEVTGEARFYQSATTSSAYLRVENNRARNAAVRLKTTVGDYYIGTGIGADVNQFQLFDGNAGVNRLTISSTGAATFSSSVTAGLEFTTVNGYGFRSYVGASASGANIQFTSSYYSGWDAIYQSSGNTNNFGIWTNGGLISQPKFVITNSGNIGIGTTTINYASGNRTVMEINGTSEVMINLKTGDANRAYIYHNGTNLYTENSRSGGDWYLAQVGAGSMIFNTNGSERMRITSSGNVGIGTNSPSTLLDVRGSGEGIYVARIAGSVDFGAHVRIQKARGSVASPTIVANGDTLGTLTFEPHNGSIFTEQVGIRAIVNGTVSAGSVPTDLFFSTGASGTTAVNERMRITSAGRVGIGTTDPVTNLQLGRVFGFVQDINSGYIQANMASSGNYIVSQFATRIHLDSALGEINFLNAPSGTAGTAVSLSTRMKINSDGRIQTFVNGVNGQFQLHQSNSGFNTDAMMYLFNNRNATSSYNFAKFFSGYPDNTQDIEFNFRGDGTGFSDGGWTTPASDYAEYFESLDSASLPIGATVVLEQGKVKLATESSTSIIGVIRPKNAALFLGNNAEFKWNQKYLKDDFGAYLLDDDGMRTLNPDYDPSFEYIPREKRDEWNIVGLVGQVPILKDQPKNPNWVKMYDVSATVEMWLIK